MNSVVRTAACIAFASILCSSADADEILFSDNFDYGISDSVWTEHGTTEGFGSEAIILSTAPFQSGLESVVIDQPPADSTLYVQGYYWTRSAGPYTPAGRGIVAVAREWDPCAYTFMHRLEFVTEVGDTSVNRIRYVASLVGAVDLDSADLGSFAVDTGYTWRFGFTGAECEIFINGELRHSNGSIPMSSYVVCLTGAEPNGWGHWDDIEVGLMPATPVESLSWGRVKALFK